MNLSEFYNYKNQLMKDLLTNERIVQLLQRDGETITPRNLMYTQVFPFEFLPDTVEAGRTYVCCDVDIQRSYNKTFLEPVLHIWIFTHKSLMRLPEGGVRVDTICHEIAKAIEGSMYYGLGRLELYSVKRFAPMAEYNGKVMTFNLREFNMPSPRNGSIPTNRKRGV